MGPPIRALAVLPLENLSRDPEQEYFADGMTDDLITELSKISALRVISRTSVMPLKRTRQGPAQIARQLGVDALVTGTVLRSAERVRVSAQVIQISPEKNLWADRYERPLGDVVILQGMLAREIADAIRVKLTPQEEHRFAQGRYVDEEAREAHLKGRYYWNKRTEEATWKAIDYFQFAISKDRNDARAYAGLADSYLSLALVEALQEAIPPNEGFPKAREAVTRALEIDETLGEAHATLGHIHFQYDRDWAGAEREFKRAIELNPNYANAPPVVCAVADVDGDVTTKRSSKSLTRDNWIRCCSPSTRTSDSFLRPPTGTTRRSRSAERPWTSIPIFPWLTIVWGRSTR